jgi:hypothetical protein
MSLAFDEYGRPFIIIRVSAKPWRGEQEKNCALSCCRARDATPCCTGPSAQPLSGQSEDYRSARTARLGRLEHSPLTTHAHLFSPTIPIRQEQDAKSRISGLDAVKANIQACKAVSRVLRSSLGPKGMDKMMQSPDGDVTISAFSGREEERERKAIGQGGALHFASLWGGCYATPHPAGPRFNGCAA